MKKICPVFVFIVSLLLFFCACGETVQAPELVSVRIEYLADEGGIIEGKAVQEKTVIKGESAEFNTVTAIPSEGYTFIGWDDGKKEMSRSDKISESVTFVALFEKIPTYKITYLATEGGLIEGVCEQEIQLGKTSATVKAVPNDGYKFIGWDDGITESERSDAGDGEKTFTARFELIKYGTVNYKSAAGGTIEGEATQTVEYGFSTNEVTAVAKAGYTFVSWNDGVTSPTRSDIADGDKTYLALFSRGGTATYSSTEGGYIDGEIKQSLSYGQKTSEVTAIPDDGYMFISWSDGSTENPRCDTVKTDLKVTAIFKSYYTVQYFCNDTQGKIIGESEQTIIDGEYGAEVTAEAKSGFEFIMWSSGETTPTISTLGKETATYTAYFSPKSTGLPVISINTEGNRQITSKTEYISCVITVYDTETGEYHVCEESAEIRGRGNLK